MVEPVKVCRYLEPGGHCAYWDEQLIGDEDIKCYPGGWECYEESGPHNSVVYEGMWYGIADVIDYYKSQTTLPEVIKIPDGVMFAEIADYYDRNREKLYGADNGRELK